LHEPTTPDEQRIAVVLTEVRAALRAGRLDDGLARLRALLDDHPTHPEALRLLSVAYHQAGDLERSLQAARSAAVVGPSVASAHYQLGLVCFDRGDRDGAVEAYTRALELAPHLTPAWINLGRIHDEAFRFDQALACYDHALALEPDELVAHTNRGNTLLGMERFVEAAASFARAAAIDPNHWPARLGQASALAELGHLDQVAALPVAGTPADRGPLRECVRSCVGGDIVVRWFDGRHTRPEWLAHEAEQLGARVAAAVDGGAAVDQPFDIGLCPASLRPEGDRFVVCVPDLRRDPVRHRTAIASFYLQSVVMAGVLGATVRQPPAVVSWLQTVSVGANALDAQAVVLVREPPVDPADSGWRIDGGPDTAERLRLPIATILTVRPMLARAFTLPVAWQVRMDGDRMVSARDASGQERLASTGPERR